MKEFDFVKVFQTVDKNNDLTHQSRAITHEYIIIAYNADGSVLFVDFSRKELEDAKGTISKNYYDTISYEFEKHLAIEAQTNLKI